MRLTLGLIFLVFMSYVNAFAVDQSTEIISEPPEVRVTIITNAWTTRLDAEIETFKNKGYSPQNITKIQSAYEDIKRQNPSETINCITPCSVTIPYENWQRSEIKAIKLGFPTYSRQLRSYSKFGSKTPPKQINLKLDTPEMVPESCIFDDGYTSTTAQEEQPCYRPLSASPKSLRRKKLSYKCYAQFDLDNRGKTQNILITKCPKKLSVLAYKNVKSWRYVPKTDGGKTVAVKGVRSNVVYNYYDKHGRKYPLSN